MNNFWTGYGFGGALGASRVGRRMIGPLLKLFLVGVLIAGVMYACIVFRAASERSKHSHVHAHSTH